MDMAFFPVLCGSAFKNKGVQALLDAVVAFLPSPLDLPPVKGINPDTEEEEERLSKDDQPFAALAFKIATDPFVGRLCFMRVYSGSLSSGSTVINMRTGKKERISRLLQMHSNNQKAIPQVGAGDICAGVGFKNIKTGDTLVVDKHPIILEDMSFPDPVIGYAIEPKKQADSDKLANALMKLTEEDPTLIVKTNEETGQTVLRGMGELHLEIIIDRLRREFNVEINQGAPQVAYKETITTNVEHRELYKKQTGGRGKYADIQFELMPGDEETEGLEFIDEIKGGVIPKEYIPSVKKGFQEAMKTGVLAGFEVPKMKVRLFYGSYHDVDSDSLSFELAARVAFRESAKKANPVLLEPIMEVEVVTPDNYTGTVIGDLSKRRGMPKGQETRAGAIVVKADVPLSELFGYITDLRNITAGRASATLTFSHYSQVPRNIAETVISDIKSQK